MIPGQLSLEDGTTLEVVRLRSGQWHLVNAVDSYGYERAWCGVKLSRVVQRVPVTKAEAERLTSCGRCRPYLAGLS